MTCPIKIARASIPPWMKDIHDYDGLELHPVRDHFWNEDEYGPFVSGAFPHRETCCEPCDPDEAHFWSLYGHLKLGGICCLEDFLDLTEARRFACKMLRAWPHLRLHGLQDFSYSCQLDLFSSNL